jgi:hypothetical protein
MRKCPGFIASSCKINSPCARDRKAEKKSYFQRKWKSRKCPISLIVYSWLKIHAGPEKSFHMGSRNTEHVDLPPARAAISGTYPCYLEGKEKTWFLKLSSLEVVSKRASSHASNGLYC